MDIPAIPQVPSTSANDEHPNDIVTHVHNTYQSVPQYQLMQVYERHSRKFNVKEKEYLLKVDGFVKNKTYDEYHKQLHELLDNVMDDLMRNVDGKDKIRISLSSSSLHHDIWLPFTTKCGMTTERLMQEVSKVLQSNDSWIFEEFNISFVHAPIPHGSGYVRNISSLERELGRRQCFIRIQNKDTLCCARAIVTAKAKLEKHKQYSSIKQGREIQGYLAEKLHIEAGIPTDLPSCGPDEWQKFQKVLPSFQLLVISREHMNAIIFHGPTKQRQIVIYLAQKHYSVITTMTGFLRKSYYCITCRTAYDHRLRHKCAYICENCRSEGECMEDGRKQCKSCFRWFLSETCFNNHITNNTCKRLYLCKCQQLVNKDNGKHKCGYKQCKLCKSLQPLHHKCYMQIIKNNKEEGKKLPKTQQFIFYDCESLTKDGKHISNLIISHLVCDFCITLPMNDQCVNCQREQRVFRGLDSVNQFCDYLFDGTHEKHIVIAHNASGYDLHHIMPYIHENGIKPEVIQNGHKILCLKAYDIKFIDSLSFLPMALEQLPKAFSLNELSKGFFPHLFSTIENQNYNGPIPDKDYYNPGGMSEKKHKEFSQWYEEHRHDHFNYQEELVKYCISDVDILQRACGKFRELFIAVSNVDPFKEAITIASACNVVFRKNFLKPKTIAIIPPNGYGCTRQCSALALTWLHSVSKETGQRIRHMANGGEIIVEGLPIDGISGDPADMASCTLYTFYGDFYHGCKEHYERNTKNPLNDTTMGVLYDKTIERENFLRTRGYKVVSMWECTFRSKYMTDELRQVYANYLVWEPLNPRDGFFGGRTNAVTLYKETKEDETIEYVDYTSLYPWVCKYGKYPLGHPKVYTKGDPDMPTSINGLEGLVKCTVLPPTNLFHPVLPYRCNNKLTFPLCRTCVESLQQTPCHHIRDEERALTGTWVTMELEKAMEMGYSILDIHAVWHFSEVTQYNKDTKEGGLFTEYIDLFLQKKVEASGYPSWCKGPDDENKYIDDYLRDEGVQLNKDNIKSQPALRALAKLQLNSFWGKLGERPNKEKVIYIDDPVEYFRYMKDDDKEILDLSYVNEECIRLRYRNKDDFTEILSNTNVVLACYTTAQARLRLYSLLESLNERVLYFDTDSVVYVNKPGMYSPELDDLLGGLKSELDPGVYIKTFISGGPKNYAYLTSDGQTICKIRGFTLNTRNSLILNFESMKNIVTSPNTNIVPIHEPYKIVRKDDGLYTIQQKKDYRMVYDKRVLLQNFSTVPYGWKI